MKLKSLVVITLLVLGYSFASAQTYTFGFADANGNLSCNYEQFSIGSQGLVSGIDNLSLCGISTNGSLVGLQGKFPLLGPKYVTPGATLTNNSLEVEEGCTGEQVILYTALKCNQPDKNGKYHGKYGWLVVLAIDGYIMGENYGYLSCTIPAKGDGDALMRGTTWGKLREKLRK